ncbi:dynamin family protein [Romboutsia sp.]|uniref:dynamin family protein n=1 Tax=Romboutsia sp. TaxID=1965302 RepID=UPI003F374746
MQLSREEEYLKLMDIIKNLKKMICLMRDNSEIDYEANNEYVKLINYIEEEVIKNEESIKELKEPFLLFVVGGGNYGKSTLINALLKEKIVETTDIPNTWKLDLFIKSKKERMEITYQDNSKSIKSSKEGIKLLKREEEKYKVSRKKILRRVKEYKNTKELTLDELKEHRKRLENEYLYKSNIIQIKYYISKGDILEDFVIVDTPGLNQVLLKNTFTRVKKYYEKADGVIWLIDAQNIVSKENNKIIEEIEEIDTLHSKKKNIIAVINKIDIIRKDNIANLAKVRRKVMEIYEDKFDDIVFISAKEALEGLINEDDNLIEKSNIKYLYQSIDKNFKNRAEENQIKSKYKNLYIMKDSILDKIYNYKRNLYKDISIYNESQFEQKDKIKDLDIYVKNRLEEFKKGNYEKRDDIIELKKEVEELQNVCNLNLENLYEHLYIKSNFKPNKTEKDINTNLYFTRSKHIVFDYNKSYRINNNNINFINKIENILNKSNSKSKSDDEVLLINTIIPQINFLIEEIVEVVDEKLNLIHINLNETREESFREKHIDYLSVKKHIDYLDNIENIMKILR